MYLVYVPLVGRRILAKKKRQRETFGLLSPENPSQEYAQTKGPIDRPLLLP